MNRTTERRHGYRISIRLEAYCSDDLIEVVGVIANISYSGALLEDTSMQPEVGTPCVLYLYPQTAGRLQSGEPI